MPVALERLLLGVILVVAACLRFYDLDRTSLWFDEAASWDQARRPFAEMLAATAADNYPPLHNIVLHFTILFFGESETALRLPSAVLGTLTVFLIYLLGKALWDGRTGILAALILALSSFHIWYSQEARMYALLACTATLFVLASLRLARHPSWATAAACSAAGTALLYSHPYGPLVFGAVNLVFLARWKPLRLDWKLFFATQAVSCLLFLPWAIVLLGRAVIVAQDFWIPYPKPRYIYWTLSALAGDLMAPGGIAGEMAEGDARPGVLALPVLALLSALAFLRDGIVGAGRWGDLDLSSPADARRFSPGFANLLVGGWLLLPLVAAFLLSITIEPILQRRYLICTLPALCLLGGRGLALLSANRVALAAALVLLFCAVLPPVHAALQVKARHDIRAASAVFRSEQHSGDRIAFYRPYNDVPFRYYIREPLPFLETPLVEADAPRLWLVVGFASPAETARLLAELDRNYDTVAAWTFEGVQLFLLTRSYSAASS